MIKFKLNRFKDKPKSTDKEFASASSNVVLRNSAIAAAPDHDDPFYGTDDKTNGIAPGVVDEVAKPAAEMEDAQDLIEDEDKEAAKISKTDIESLEAMGLHLTPLKNEDEVQVDKKIMDDDSIGGDAELIGLGF